MPGLPFRTRLTVASLTPACLATSASFPATPQFYGIPVQTLAAMGLGVGRRRRGAGVRRTAVRLVVAVAPGRQDPLPAALLGDEVHRVHELEVAREAHANVDCGAVDELAVPQPDRLASHVHDPCGERAG